MTTPSTDPARWLNGVAPRATPRNQRETTAMLTSIRKEDRHLLTSQQKLKLQTKCEEGLPKPHFDFLTHENSSDLKSLKSLYSVRMKVEELRLSLTSEDMHGVFTVPSMMTGDPTGIYNLVPAAGSAPLDMFHSIQELELELVQQWSEFLLAAGEPYLVENLLWSAMKIKNSLSDGLREKLIEKTMGWPIIHQTGIVYFKLVMNFIEESTPKSTRSIITKLQDLSVKDYDGENINLVTSTIKGAYEILSNKRAVPIDFLDIVFDILETCSVDKFTTHIRGIRTNHDQKVKTVDLNYLLYESENKYLSIDDWPSKRVEDQDSTFNVSEVECWNCGEKGHFSNECPHPRRSGRGSGRGKGRGGRGRGRGRGRRQGGRGSQYQGRSSYDRQKDPRFRPPGKDDPRVRTLGEVVEYWCGTCRCWTNHPTDKHTEITMLAEKPGNLKARIDDQSQTDEESKSSKPSSDTSSLTKSFAGMLSHFG